VKRIFLIVLLSVALNFSFQPSATALFEKSRITVVVFADENSHTSTFIKEQSEKKIAVRSSLYLKVMMSQALSLSHYDSS
jgi:hypothetical protein